MKEEVLVIHGGCGIFREKTDSSKSRLELSCV
jgi:hypothetical protein